MKKLNFNNWIPYLAGILIFVIITLVYFNPLLTGKKLRQDDILRHKGMSKEIVDFREKSGEEPLWTNSMFGGMPAYQISVQYKSNLLRYADKVLDLGIPRPANYVFLYFVGFFILLLVLRVNPWLSIIGAIAFAFSSYFFIILEAGHNSKAHAIAYMAPVLAGILLTYRGRYLWGGLMTAFFLGLELLAGHPQITYYLLLIVLLYGFCELAGSIRKKTYAQFFKATGVLVLAALLALSTNITSLWATWEYGKETIRGKSELTSNIANKTSGLDKDYATQWSYGVGETFTLLIPNAKGGGTELLGNNKDALEKADRTLRQNVARMNQYWGDQPFTSGPVYVGSIIVFLFVLGMFLVKGRLKWVLFSATLLSVMLSWGKNFMPLTDFFLDYIPGYNKFRAVSMTLVIAELCIPLLAMLALNEIIKNQALLKEKRKLFFISFGITGGLALIFYLLPSWFFNFISAQEQDQFRQLTAQYGAAQVKPLVDALEDVRAAVFRADAIRSFFYILLAAVALWLFSAAKFGKGILMAVMGLLIFLDMVFVVARYLNKEDYIRPSRGAVPYEASVADQSILADKSPGYRVLNIAANTFNDAGTSYFHRSIGGYHGAKLRRYQELIDHEIEPEIRRLRAELQNASSYGQLESVFKNTPVLNMLNARYVIIDPAQPPLVNNYVTGPAWCVDDYLIVDNADQEIKALESFNPETTAIIDKRFENQLQGFILSDDSTCMVKLINYKPNHLTYSFNSATDQLVVFSEIYYAKGWKAYISEKEVPFFRANYVLRAMKVPAGNHVIGFKFEPEMFYAGEAISLSGSLLLIVLLIAAVLLSFRRRKMTADE